MDKRSTEFPAEIKARWDALAAKGIAPDMLAAFEKYLFGKEAAKPEQVAAFSELMHQLPAGDPAFKPVTDHLFDELYKKYHHSKDDKESVRAITSTLLGAQHGADMRFVAENILGSKSPHLVAGKVNIAVEDACREILVMPREHARQTQQLMKSALRRHMLHELHGAATGHEAKEHFEAPPRVLGKEAPAETGSGERPVHKKAAHHVLPQSKLAGHQGVPHTIPVITKKAAHHVLPHSSLAEHGGLAHTATPVAKREAHDVLPHGRLLANKARKPVVNGGATSVDTPIQADLFEGEVRTTAVHKAAETIPPAPKPFAAAAPSAVAPPAVREKPSYTFVIEGGRSYLKADTSDIERRLAHPIPVTAAEKAEAHRKRIKDEKKAAYEAGGGFIGMVGRALRISHTERVEEERAQEPDLNTKDMVRGK